MLLVHLTKKKNKLFSICHYTDNESYSLHFQHKFLVLLSRAGLCFIFTLDFIYHLSNVSRKTVKWFKRSRFGKSGEKQIFKFYLF